MMFTKIIWPRLLSYFLHFLRKTVRLKQEMLKINSFSLIGAFFKTKHMNYFSPKTKN